MKRSFSMIIYLVYTFLGAMSSAGCTKTNTMPATTITNPIITDKDTGSYSYLALGDSYTIGQGVQEKERFPFLITELLRQKKLFVTNLKYIAQTGWPTSALQNAIAAAEPLGNFDIVTLLIGVNDQYQSLDTAGYRTRFTQLLLKSIGLVNNKPERVFVLSIPDYSATPFVDPADKTRVRKEIDAFNVINKEITLHYNISYTDITDLTREASINPELLAGDRLHYSALEHYKWAEKLLPSITAVLK